MPKYKVIKRQPITSGEYWYPGKILELTEDQGAYWQSVNVVEPHEEEPVEAGSDETGDPAPSGIGSSPNGGSTSISL